MRDRTRAARSVPSRFCVPLLLISVSWVAAAQDLGPAGQPTGAPPQNYKGLVARMRQAGLRLEEGDIIRQTFFTPTARVIHYQGDGEAQVYEYADERKAASEARQVNADGSIGTSMPLWIAPPHFFRRDRLLVLYLGSDPKVLGALSRELGPQFAPRAGSAPGTGHAAKSPGESQIRRAP